MRNALQNFKLRGKSNYFFLIVNKIIETSIVHEFSDQHIGFVILAQTHEQHNERTS